MIEITKDNYKDIDFNGVIISVPRVSKRDELKQEFCFKFECAYRTQGKHGYKTPGYNPDRSSFYTIWYGDEDMPNGFGFNSTSRLPWDEEYLYFDNVRYYKFDNMEEFCLWYLQKKGNYRITDKEGWLVDFISPEAKQKKPEQKKSEHKCQCHKSTRKERLKEVQEYVQRVMNIADCKYSYDRTQDIRYKQKVEEQQKELLDWLNEEV